MAAEGQRIRVSENNPRNVMWSRPKSIGDINEQAGRMLAMSNANTARTRRIQAISQTYRNNINERLKSVDDYSRRARIRVSADARRGIPKASLR